MSASVLKEIMIDQLLSTWLSKISTPGALQEHFWRNPAEWNVMQRYMAEDDGTGFADSQRVMRGFGAVTLAAHSTKRRAWRNWSIAHIDQDRRLYVVAALHPATHLAQPEFNFLTAADHAARRYGVKRPADYEDIVTVGESVTMEQFGERALTHFRIEPEQKALAEAFARQMVEDAAPHRQRVVIGSFEMAHVPLPQLDARLRYDALRMVIDQRGIAASLIGYTDKECWYSPFWWSPEDFTGWSLGGPEAFALQIMMSCIWRDACIVRHATFYERSRSALHPRPHKQERRGKLVLPRTVKICAWSQPDERERVTRDRHGVRLHYRQLPTGWKASRDAIDNARLYGQPPPPSGWTFVSPHQRGRGEGEMPTPVTPVICVGLQTAAIALS
jgi:hypothetical protein